MAPRPRRQLIQRDDIARATLEIIDADGLDNLSLERIANALGVRAPSLYHHFNTKQEILAFTASRILAGVRVPPDLPPPLTIEWMVQTCVAVRAEILLHPNAVPLLASHFPRRLLTTAFERMSERLLSIGVPVELHLMVFEGMERLLLGSVLAATARFTDAHDSDDLAADPLRHPVLDEALRANKWNEEELFAETLRRFLRGALEDLQPDAAARSIAGAT